MCACVTISGVLAIGALSLFMVHKPSEGGDDESKYFQERIFGGQYAKDLDTMAEELFPVVTVCPVNNEWGSQIKEITCSGYGPDSSDDLLVAPQQVSVTVEQNEEELFDCFTTNEQQDFYGTNASHYISCSVTYNEYKAVTPGRVTIWANPNVWPHAVFQAPSASTYRWKTFFQDRQTKFNYQITKYSPRDKDLWLTELQYGEIETYWNTTDEENGEDA